jgi:hypothetical protein
MLLSVFDIRKMSLNALTSGLVTSLAKPHSGNNIATRTKGSTISRVRILGLIADSVVVIYALLHSEGSRSGIPGDVWHETR